MLSDLPHIFVEADYDFSDLFGNSLINQQGVDHPSLTLRNIHIRWAVSTTYELNSLEGAEILAQKHFMDQRCHMANHVETYQAISSHQPQPCSRNYQG